MNNRTDQQGDNLRKGQEEQQNRSNTIKDPDNWTTGDEPMTGAQKSYLTTLSEEAGEEVDASLSKAEASKKIDELQHKTGRGLEQKQEQETDTERTNKNEDQGIRGGKSSY